LTRGLTTLPGNQEPCQDKVARPQVNLGWANTWNVILSLFSALTLLVGWRKGIQSVESWVLVCWWWWLYWSFAGLTAPFLTITSVILAPVKSRMVAFWYQLTQVGLENCH